MFASSYSVTLPLTTYHTPAMPFPLFLLASLLLVPLLIVLSAVVFLVAGAFKRILFLHVIPLDTYRNIPRPRYSGKLWSFPIFGHLSQIRKLPPAEAHLAFAEETASFVYCYRTMFYHPRLWIGDVKGLLYILSPAQAYDYPKPSDSRKFLDELLGKGILSAEGDIHRRQRRVVAPAFSVSSVRSFTPSFFKHSLHLVRLWEEIIDRTQGPADKSFIGGQSDYAAKVTRKSEPVFDVGFWLGKCTLDIIGENGFGHAFKSLESSDEGDGQDLGSTLNALFSSTSGLTVMDILRIFLQTRPGMSWVRKLPSKRATNRRNMYLAMEKAAQKIIAAKRVEIRKEMEALGEKGLSKSAFDEDIDGGRPKDLLHLTMRANMASDLRANEKLDDDELLGQMTSFMLAGHETTSTQTQWALYCLAEHPAVVQKLRAEIEEVFGDRDEVSYGELEEMKYLDCVAKEMHRCYAPVSSTMRTCQKDDIIPLGRSYPLRDGSGTFDCVPVFKGQDLLIPLQTTNFHPEIWGPDAKSFRPERWLPGEIPRSAKESGLPTHILTFLAGPRSCVGQRFAVVEFKVLLACLVRKFDVEHVDGWVIDKKQEIVLRATVQGQEDVGLQMPLRIKRARARASSTT